MKIQKVLIVVVTDDKTYTEEVDLNELLIAGLNQALEEGYRNPAAFLRELAEKGYKGNQ